LIWAAEDGIPLNTETDAAESRDCGDPRCPISQPFPLVLSAFGDELNVPKRAKRALHSSSR
jgi:hypothetical protein